MTDADDLVIRTKRDLTTLGRYLRRRRKHLGMSLSTNAAPWLGVGARTLLEVESGKRGITLTKLLVILEGLGLELTVRRRRSSGGSPR